MSAKRLPPDFCDIVRAGCSHFEIEVAPGMLERTLQFAELLYEWNERFNLTSIEPAQAAMLHFVDSLSVGVIVNTEKPRRVLDLGTGAGFPGIVLKIFYPDIEMTLIDSKLKALDFTRTVARELGLEKIHFAHGRAEALVENAHFARRFDLVVARSVAPFPRLLEYLFPFARAKGCVVTMKGPQERELSAESVDVVKRLGVVLERTHCFQLPSTDIERVLLQFRM